MSGAQGTQGKIPRDEETDPLCPITDRMSKIRTVCHSQFFEVCESPCPEELGKVVGAKPDVLYIQYKWGGDGLETGMESITANTSLEGG